MSDKPKPEQFKWGWALETPRYDHLWCAYRQALAEFMAGVTDVVFPAGTYWMVKYTNANCLSPDEVFHVPL